MRRHIAAPDFNKKWGEWQRSLDRIEEELHKLYFARGMFERLDKHLKVRNSLLSIYSQNTYVVYLAMGIRRLIDRAPEAQSLYRLLEDIRGNACQISVENYAQYMFKKKKHNERINDSSGKTANQKRVLIESYQKEERKLARRAFREALGNRVQSLCCCDVEDDIKKIEEGPKKGIKKLADKCWAHMDKKKPIKIKFHQAHKDFGLLINIYNKYSLLTAGRKLELDDNTLFSGWDGPFRMP